MKKVIIAFDGKNFSEGAFKFLTSLNTKQQVLATGIFLPGAEYAELLYSLGGVGGPLYYMDFEVDDTVAIQKNIDHFKMRCNKNGIEYSVHADMGMHVVSELISETRFADLLILGSELFYEKLGKDTQEGYIAEVLHNAECPLVLVPERYKNIENVVLAYDGSASSVYAIKQFAYLLPEFVDLRTLLVSVGDIDGDSVGITNIEELATRHFKDLTIQKLDLNAKKYFNTWLQSNENTLLVAGAYHRSSLSEWLRKSFILETLRDHKLPIFVAHR